MTAPRETTTPNPSPEISTMSPLDEATRRLPGFREGTPLAMTNGQAWHIPRPRPVLAAAIGEEVNPALARLGGDLARITSVPILEDRVFAGLLRLLGAAIEENDVVKAHGFAASAAIRLLRTNYSLTIGEALSLLPPLDISGPGPGLSTLLDAVTGASARETEPAAA